MHKLAIVLGFAAVMAASQAHAANAFGTITFRFAKPGAEPAAFLDDRDACGGESTTMKWIDYGRPSGFYYNLDWREFLRCMAGKGYRPAQDGDLVARMPYWA